MSATQTEQEGGDAYESLDPEEKVFIDEYIQHPEKMPVEIERELDFEMGEGNRIATDYSDIIEQRQDALETGELTESDLFGPDDLEAAEAEAAEAEEVEAEEPAETEAEAEDEPDTGTTRDDVVSKEADEKTYDELTPLQQRVIDFWVRDVVELGEDDVIKRDIEEAAGASPGYSARLFRKYGDIRDARRAAYEEGILTDDDLNTPPRDAFIEDTSLPEDEQEKIPEDEQPTGTSIAAAEERGAVEEAAEETEIPEDELEEEAEELEEEAAVEVEAEADTDTATETGAEADTATETETEADTAAEPAEPEQLELPEEGEYARREEVESLEATTETLRSEVEGMDDRLTSLEDSLDSIQTQLDDVEELSVASDGEDGPQAVQLDLDDWMVVVRSIPDDRDDLLSELIAQIR